MIEAFTRALLRGDAFAQKNKAGTLKDCAALNPEEGADATFAGTLFDLIVARAKPIGGVPVGDFTADAWNAWQDSLIASRQLTKPLDNLNAVWTNRFVDQAHQAGL